MVFVGNFNTYDTAIIKGTMSIMSRAFLSPSFSSSV